MSKKNGGPKDPNDPLFEELQETVAKCGVSACREPTVLVDRETDVIVYANPAAVQLVRKPRATLFGMALADAVPSEAYASLTAQWDQNAKLDRFDLQLFDTVYDVACIHLTYHLPMRTRRCTQVTVLGEYDSG